MPCPAAQMHSLIRAFTVHYQNHWLVQNVYMESKCPDEAAPRAVQDDVTMHILRMLGHFLASATHMVILP